MSHLMQPPKIVALMLMGARPEPFLPAVLNCLDSAVDHVIVHDNSGRRNAPNRQVLERSALYTSGRVGICEAPFVNFSQARNECLAYMRRQLICDENTWVMVVDCDEVHGDDLSFVTRRLLHSLPQQVGVVDAYFFNFILSFELYNALDRRHNLLVRYNEKLHWKLDVHEQLHGVVGRRLCLPYTYHHYGYIRSTSSIVDKWKLYRKLGDETYSASVLDQMDANAMFGREVDRALYYSGTYPAALAVLGDVKSYVDADLEKFHKLVAIRLKRPLARCQAQLRDANYRMRLLWRAIQWLFERRRLSDARRLFSMTLLWPLGLSPQRAA